MSTPAVKLKAPVPASDPDDPMIGRTLDDRYTITGRVGKGSMGTVYRARQNVMDRDVAIKILRQDRAVDDSSKARFFREAKAQSVLQSPNTVTVFDFGQTPDDELYLAMELLEGESLGQRLARVKRLTPDDAIETTRQVLRSLGEAHAKGIIHRDLKPDNIFFARVVQGGSTNYDTRRDEIVKVLDFGIAKLTAVGATAAGELNVVETQAGTVFGTPRYMSPEQAQGKPLDARTDLYSLGVMLYQMLAGRPPFTDTDAVVVMARHIRTIPKSLREVAPDVKVPPELESLVMRVLSKDPNDRPANAEAMIAGLARALENARELGMAQTSGVRPSMGELPELLPDSVRSMGAVPISTDFATRPYIPVPPIVDSEDAANGDARASARAKKSDNPESTASAMDTLGSAAYDAAGTGRRSKLRLGVGVSLAIVALVAIVGASRVRPHAGPQVVATSSNTAVSPVSPVSPASPASLGTPGTPGVDSAQAPAIPSGNVIELPDMDNVPTVAVTSLAPVASSPSAPSGATSLGSGGANPANPANGGRAGRHKPRGPKGTPDKPPASYGLFEN